MGLAACSSPCILAGHPAADRTLTAREPVACYTRRVNLAPERPEPGPGPALIRPALTRWHWLLIAAVLVAALIVAWLRFQSPQTLSVSGESVSTSRVFALTARRYALSADLLGQCQYTFYLTPEGQLWNRAGRAIASASGETGLSAQTGPAQTDPPQTDSLGAGRYFIHALTSPDEGCSWTLRLAPQ